MSENKIKPCPLCGETNTLSGVEYIPRGKMKGINVGFIECLTDNCPMIIRAATVEDAIGMWNKRPIESKLEKDTVNLKNNLLYVYEQLVHMSYIDTQMEASEEKDRMMRSVLRELIKREIWK